MQARMLGVLLAAVLLPHCHRGAGLTEPANLPPVTATPYVDRQVYDYTPRSSEGDFKGLVKKRLAVARFQDNLPLEQSPFGRVVQVPDGSLLIVSDREKSPGREREEIRLGAGSRQLLVPEGGLVNPQFQEMVIQELQRTQRFTVVERRDINAILRELKFGESKWVSQENSEKAGNLLGAQLILTGSFAWNDDPATFDSGPLALYLRLYETGSGRVVAAERATGNALSELIRSAVQLVAQKAEQIPWSARVAGIQGEYLYINDGVGSNLAVGDNLALYTRGAPIYDPADPKLLLGYAEEENGAAQVVSVEAKLSKVRLTQKLRPVRVGDVVKLSAVRSEKP